MEALPEVLATGTLQTVLNMFFFSIFCIVILQSVFIQVFLIKIKYCIHL